MEANLMKLSEYINNCLLPKLSKEHYEKDHHFEYQLRNNALLETFDKLEFLIATVDFSHQSELVSSTLSHLMILYFEIECTAPWNTKQIQDNHYALKLNQIFLNKYKVNVEDVFKDNQFECQVIFDKCIQEMHKKMTTDNVRKYPGLIEAYCLLIRNVKDYKININPVTVLPVALLLMDDFITANQIKGLKSCKYVLQSLTEKDFAAGNYYEVVYSSLKKNITVREKEVAQALFPCLIEFFRLVPPDCKKNKLDDVFASVLDHLYLESNLYKKAECFDFLTKVIEMHGIHCGKKKIFKEIVRDNLDHCSIKNISDILLLHVLECYEMWLRYCWCMWKLSEDHKMLSTLIKILYLTKDEKIKIRIQKLFVTLVKLCTGEEQKDILDNLDDPLKWSDEDFYSTITKTKWLITRKLS